MKKFTKNYQPQISEKYKLDFSDFSLQEVLVPDINEYIGTIYLFVNNINNKVYVGQTMTKFYSRFTGHFGDSHKRQDNLPFHKAIEKYGWSNFSKYIIWQSEIFERNEENKKILRNILDEKEIEFVKIYNSNNPEFGYNATAGGFYMPESAYTKESIQKAIITKEKNHSNHMLGKTYNKHHLAVHILQYSLNKEFIKEWDCIKLAEDTLGFSILPSGITSGGYFWIYNNDNKEEQLNKKYLDYNSLKSYGKSKTVFCFDLFGEFVGSYNSCGAAAKLFNIKNPSEIAHAAKNKENGNIVHNYIWIYEEDLGNKYNIINSLVSRSKVYKSKYKPIYQIFLNGEIIKLWNCLDDIINETKLNRGSLNKCLNHKMNAYMNCFWIYEENYSDDIILSKLESFKKTKKALVNKILSGEIKYEGLNIETHDATKTKQYLKEHPRIYQYDKSLKLVKKWDNYKDIEKEIPEFKFANISKCLRKNMKTAYNYIWRFEEEILNNNIL